MRNWIFAGVVGVLLVVGTTVGVIIGFPDGSDRTYYLALGDSIAAGQGSSDAERFGYVALVGSYFEETNRGPERFVNLAVPGEKSSTILGDQLATALELINDSGKDVQVVTLTIGSNDFLPLSRNEPCASEPGGGACAAVVGEVLAGFAANYQAILTELTSALAADPGEERIFVTTYFNPYDGPGSPLKFVTDATLLGADGAIDCGANAADPRTIGVNDLIVCIGGQFGAEPVDLYPLFVGEAPSLTHIGQGDVHPNDRGHRLIADTIIAVDAGRGGS